MSEALWLIFFVLFLMLIFKRMSPDLHYIVNQLTRIADALEKMNKELQFDIKFRSDTLQRIIDEIEGQ